jgi:hypothetical protein
MVLNKATSGVGVLVNYSQKDTRDRSQIQIIHLIGLKNYKEEQLKEATEKKASAKAWI